MDVKKLDLAIDVLEDIRRLKEKMDSLNTDDGLRSREFSLAVTEVETAKLWMQEVVVKQK